MESYTEETKADSRRRHSAYIPVHRRTGSGGGGTVADSISSTSSANTTNTRPPTQEYSQSTFQNRSSMSNGGDADQRRSSRQFAWTRQQQQQKQQHKRYSLMSTRHQDYYDGNSTTPEDSLDDTLTRSNYNDRRRSTSMIPAERLSMTFESMSLQDEHDWEEFLRQYDRYEDMGHDVSIDSNAAKRSNSSIRASRVVDQFHEVPVEIPAAEEPTTILDCLDFPSAFKTHHLHDIFREYVNMRGGYRIKWMDDTRALIIFEHPATAKKAYIDNVSNPLAKIRPYSGPTDFIKSPVPSAQQHQHVSVDLKRASYSGAYGMRPERQSIRG